MPGLKKNSLVRSDDSILTTVIGLDDVIVVSTSDAVLVVPRTRAEEVKGLVEQLKTQNHRAAVEHRRIYRPWGYYQSVDTGTRYQVKRIVVKPGAARSTSTLLLIESSRCSKRKAIPTPNASPTANAIMALRTGRGRTGDEFGTAGLTS